MKKVIALALALMLCLSVAAAETVPSKTADDLTTIAVTTETGATVAVKEADEATTAEIDKLTKAESLEAYFGENLDLTAVLTVAEGETVVVYDFVAITADGFKAEDGAVKMTVATATVFADDADVAVLVGIVNGETIEWTPYDAKVVDGALEVELPQEIVQKIQAGTAYMAIIGK